MDDSEKHYRGARKDFVVPEYFNFPSDIIDEWARIEMVGDRYVDDTYNIERKDGQGKGRHAGQRSYHSK